MYLLLFYEDFRRLTNWNNVTLNLLPKITISTMKNNPEFVRFFFQPKICLEWPSSMFRKMYMGPHAYGVEKKTIHTLNVLTQIQGTHAIRVDLDSYMCLFCLPNAYHPDQINKNDTHRPANKEILIPVWHHVDLI